MQTFANRLSYFRNKKGMTMIEVLMAMAIFAIGFLAIGTMVIWTTRNTTTGNIVTQATMSAREKIEILKTLPVDQMADECPNGMEPESIPSTIYKHKCTVVEDTSTANIITVTVSWKRQGQERNVELRTLSKGNGS
jgi:prepilin-type N-terminal cleavage/methylation domain-containing protein